VEQAYEWSDKMENYMLKIKEDCKDIIEASSSPLFQGLLIFFDDFTFFSPKKGKSQTNQ
jgi:hypothetical protein